MKTIVFNIRLTEESLENLKRIAKIKSTETGYEISTGAVARKVLEDYIDKFIQKYGDTT